MAILWPSRCHTGTVSEQHQVKVSVNDGFMRRIQEAEAAGRITNKSGLGKLAFSHAMDHGQEATETLLRSNGQSAAAGQGTEEPVTELPGLASIEQRVAAGIRDVKRCIIQATAVITGLLLLLAVGMALYLRPAGSTA